MSLDNDLASYLMKLTEDSLEYEQAKKDGNLKNHLQIYNTSMQDIAILVLRWLYNKSHHIT